MSRLHHVCITTQEYEWYVRFFMEVFDMTIERAVNNAPERHLWFDQGIQINERSENEEAGNAVDHISIAVDDIHTTVSKALKKGCMPLPQGPQWFSLPNGIKMELKQL